MIYQSSAANAPVSYAAPVANLAAYPGGWISDGFGQGGYGQGGFGRAASSYQWTSDPLSSGVWQFAVVPYDKAGNSRDPGQTASVTISSRAYAFLASLPASNRDAVELHLLDGHPAGDALLAGEPFDNLMEFPMSAYASIEVSGISLARAAVPVGVYRYQPGGPPVYQYLENVRVLGIQYREGPHPGVARFRYVLDAGNPPTDPSNFQETLSVDADLPGVVQNDDRLVVFGFNPNGSQSALFDGFAQVPELSLSPDQEMVTFVAFGVAVREWDTPDRGRP